MILLTLATVATLADAAGYALVIGPGHAIERNPLVLAVGPAVALLAKGALIVLMALLVAIEARPRLVRATLGLAVVVGTAGAISVMLP